jgi:hypothetical protein
MVVYLHRFFVRGRLSFAESFCLLAAAVLAWISYPAGAQSSTQVPSSIITSPLTGATIPINSTVVIQGTAADTNGGVVAGVSVSTDGGVTWTSATGTNPWTFTWLPTAEGTVTINSQAYDAAGNVETPGSGAGAPNVAVISVTDPVCPCSVFSPSQIPSGPISNDGSPIEAGMQFVAQANGFVTALLYYKPAGIGGTRTGNLWASSGANLASQVFTGETASGWQQVTLATPVPVTAGMTYLVSYFSSTGDYMTTPDYFTQSVGSGLVHAPAEGANGPNGVYVDTASSSFPTQDAGGANYYADVVFNTTTLLSQTITFPPIPGQNLGNPPVASPVSASSGLAVTLTSTSPATCTASGASITLIAVGSCTITAGQPGDGVTYAAAAPVTQTFLISPALLLSQTITFPAIPAQTLGAAPFIPAMSASSGLPVTLISQTPATCTASGVTITLIAVGSCTITANQPGDGVTYAAAPPVTQTFLISPALLSQTITFPAIPAQTLGAAPFVPTASASSGLPVTLSSQSPATCTASGVTITLIAAGNCSITANQPGDGVTYLPAPPVGQTFLISPALLTQTISFPAVSSQTLGTPPFAPPVSATSGLPVTLASQSPAACTVSGSTITLVAVGICTVTASQPGNGTYAAATPLTQMFSISPAQVAQTINFPAVPSHTVGAAPFTVAVSASSGLPVALASQTTGVCITSGTTVTSVAAGTCTLQASQSGNSSYRAATPVAQSFVITTQSDSVWIVENRSQLTQSFTTAMSSTFTVTKFPFFFQLDCQAVVDCYDANPAGPEGVPNFSLKPTQPQQNSDWLLSTGAIVLVAETPPTMTYFGVTPYLFDEYYSKQMPKNPTGTPGTVTVFESLTDTANLDVVRTTGSATPGTNPFTQIAAFVITADSNTYNDIVNEFVALGLPASAINQMTLPVNAVPLKMGTATADDTFTVLLRTAYPANQSLLTNYVQRAPVDVLVMEPIKARNLAALPTPTYRVPGDGHNESATLRTAQGQLATTLVNKFTPNYTITKVTLPPPVQTVNYYGATNATASNGDNPDALYTQEVGFTSSFIPGPNDLLLIVGVNHDAYFPGTAYPGTGTTTYFSNSVVNPTGNQEVLGIPDSWMAGSAIAMSGIKSSSPSYANYQQLYAYTVGFNCTGQVWCATIPQPSSGNVGVTPGSPMRFVGRLYLDPLTKTRPLSSEIILDDVYILTYK